MINFNTNLFTVEDTESNNNHLIIRTTILENFKTFESLGRLILAGEELSPDWGWNIENGSRLSEALCDAGIDSNLYRCNVVEELPSKECLDRVRDLLRIKYTITPNSVFKFQ